MSQRPGATKWLWCLLAWFAGPAWSSVGSVSVHTPPKNPTTIEAQAKFFQDFFSVQLSPYKIEFGHVCEDPNTWEQRYEKKDFKNHRDMGKVRWGDKKGGYGEHYWDLNHAGHAGDHGNNEYDGSSDDGSYNHDLDHAYDGNDSHDDHNDHDAYDEPSEQSPTYGTEEYDSEKAAQYDENGRAKRAHPRIKTEKKHIREEEMYEEEPQVQPQKVNRKIKERLQAASTQQVENVAGDNDTEPQPPKRRRRQRRPQHPLENESESEQQKNQDNQQKEESNNQDPQQQNQQQQQQKQQQHQQNQPQQQQNQQPQNQQQQQHQQQQHEQQQHQQPQQYYQQRQPENQFVPYEQGAGVRQHHRPEITAAASAPRLFLEPTTGHVVDRATGQAYVLQPIAINNYN